MLFAIFTLSLRGQLTLFAVMYISFCLVKVDVSIFIRLFTVCNVGERVSEHDRRRERQFRSKKEFVNKKA